jgi:hypothetical protein
MLTSARRRILLGAAILSAACSLGIYMFAESAETVAEMNFWGPLFRLGLVGVIVADLLAALVSTHPNLGIGTGLLIATPVNFALFAGVALAIHACVRLLARLLKP